MTTTTAPTTSAPDLDVLRARQQQIWSSGDYNKIAAITVPVAEALVASVGVYPGSSSSRRRHRHGSRGAGRRPPGCPGHRDRLRAGTPRHRTSPRRRRAARRRAGRDSRRAPSFPDESFDAVVSSIGVMFAADHQQAADELVRGPRAWAAAIGLASWTPDSFIGGMLGIVGRHVPPPAGAQSPVRWGVEETVAEPAGQRRRRPPRRGRAPCVSGSPAPSRSPTCSWPTTAPPTAPPSGSRGRAPLPCAPTSSTTRRTPTAARTARSSVTGSTCSSRLCGADRSDRPHHDPAPPTEITNTARRENDVPARSVGRLTLDQPGAQPPGRAASPTWRASPQHRTASQTPPPRRRRRRPQEWLRVMVLPAFA